MYITLEKIIYPRRFLYPFSLEWVERSGLASRLGGGNVKAPQVPEYQANTFTLVSCLRVRTRPRCSSTHPPVLLEVLVAGRVWL